MQTGNFVSGFWQVLKYWLVSLVFCFSILRLEVISFKMTLCKQKDRFYLQSVR